MSQRNRRSSKCSSNRYQRPPPRSSNLTDGGGSAPALRSTLGVRKQLVGMRTEMINQIRGLMKIFGLILPKGSGARSEASVRAHSAEKAELGW